MRCINFTFWKSPDIINVYLFSWLQYSIIPINMPHGYMYKSTCSTKTRVKLQFYIVSTCMLLVNSHLFISRWNFDTFSWLLHVFLRYFSFAVFLQLILIIFKVLQSFQVQSTIFVYPKWIIKHFHCQRPLKNTIGYTCFISVWKIKNLTQ